ncbi:MAG: addiction module protein [Nitrospirae bacterium]|nr:addiction module protein [Nitrospirota bacterium]
MITVQTIFKDALSLNPVERAELIDKLYHSLDISPDDKIDSQWAVEAESRIDAYNDGLIKADSADSVFKRINRL